MQVYDGTRVTGIAARPIRAGEEVSDNYYPSAPCVARPERRRWLAEHFLFHCECGACSDNLPLLADMPDTPARFLCQQCPWSRLSPADSCCPRCGAACDPEQLTGEVSRLVTALATAVQLYQAAATADPRTHLATVQRIHTQLRYMEYFQLKNILHRSLPNIFSFLLLRSLVAHPFKHLVTAEQQYLKALKQVRGNMIVMK